MRDQKVGLAALRRVAPRRRRVLASGGVRGLKAARSARAEWSQPEHFLPGSGLRLIFLQSFLMRWFVILFLAMASLGASAAKSSQPSCPNIVFILADDLGYGEVGCFGQKVIQTPNLDRMAREGMRFTQFYAGTTVCAPSRCVLMTGKHTGHASVRGNAGGSKQALLPGEITVARA
jgi:hypothetical protein